jgi:hypothetical protein
MLGLVLLILIFIFTSLFGIVSSQGKLYEKSIWHPTKNGRMAYACGFIIIILSAIQYLLSENEKKAAKAESEVARIQTEKQLREDYAVSMAEIIKSQHYNTKELKQNYDASTIGLKSRYDTSTTNIIKALAKYGLKYDTAQQRIEKLMKDSIAKPLDLPFIAICVDPPNICQKITPNKFQFTFKLCNTTSYAANELKANIVFLTIRNNEVVLIRNAELFEENDKRLSPNGITRTEYEIEFLHSTPDVIYSYVIMKYKNSYGNTYSNKQMLCWDLKTAQSIPWDFTVDALIRDYLKKSNFY